VLGQHSKTGLLRASCLLCCLRANAGRACTPERDLVMGQPNYTRDDPPAGHRAALSAHRGVAALRVAGL